MRYVLVQKYLNSYRKVQQKDVYVGRAVTVVDFFVIEVTRKLSKVVHTLSQRHQAGENQQKIIR